MSNKKLPFRTPTVLLLVGALLMIWGSPAYAGDRCQIIRVEEMKGAGQHRIDIFPSKITVPVGTCTVWINFMREGDVQVSFRENAKQCVLSTEAPTGFKTVDIKPGETCYVSESMPRGKDIESGMDKTGSIQIHLRVCWFFSAGDWWGYRTANRRRCHRSQIAHLSTCSCVSRGSRPGKI